MELIVLFTLVPIACLLAYAQTFKSVSGVSTVHVAYEKAYNSFRRSFFIPYSLAFFGEWLQGPFMYVLCDSYGYSRNAIGLFVMFGSIASISFGLIAGMLADNIGRKKASLLFCLFSSISSLLLNVNSPIFMVLSRMFSGMASSLLWSALDAWVVTEHHRRNFPLHLLHSIYSICAFINGVVAVLAGILATAVSKYFGPLGVYNISVIFTFSSGLYVACIWNENYGKPEAEDGLSSDYLLYRWIWRYAKDHSELWCGGIVQALCEGAIQIFVLLWSPSLPNHANRGLVFSCFMASIMLGSSISSLFRQWKGLPIQIYLYLITASIAMFLGSMRSSTDTFRFGCFCLFEFCVGIHWTAFYALRARYILPGTARATFITLFRIPNNLLLLFVCSVWYRYTLNTLMKCCSCLLLLASMLFSYVHWKLRYRLFEGI